MGARRSCGQSIISGVMVLMAIIAHPPNPKLVGWHSLINIMCHNAPRFCTDSKEIVELLSLWNLSSINLSLTPTKQVNLEVLTQIINRRYFSIF